MPTKNTNSPAGKPRFLADDKGQRVSRTCPECGGKLIWEGDGIWRCNGLADPGDPNKELQACEFVHEHGKPQTKPAAGNTEEAIFEVETRTVTVRKYLVHGKNQRHALDYAKRSRAIADLLVAHTTLTTADYTNVRKFIPL